LHVGHPSQRGGLANRLLASALYLYCFQYDLFHCAAAGARLLKGNDGRTPVMSSSYVISSAPPGQRLALNFDQAEAASVLQIRTLVVDDFASFRRRVCWMLEESPEVRVVGEAVDGAEAVQKAVELQPDLILLDSDLPKLSGIEAARQIRNLAPKSRILFLSQDANAEVVQDAFSAGARGYVTKSDAARELLAAVRAISLGKQYVSRALAGFDLTDTAEE
jgi:CheY-like chemotaxis protein